MKKYLLLFFLVPSITFATVTDFSFGTPDGTYAGEDCFVYSNLINYVLTYTGSPDQLHPDWDSPSSSNGNLSISPTGSPYSGTFNWSSFSADALPVPTDGVPTHINQWRVHEGTYQVVGTQSFYVGTASDCAGSSGSGSEATTTNEQVQQNMIGLFFIFVVGFLTPFWIKL